jgi:ribosomal protein S17
MAKEKAKPVKEDKTSSQSSQNKKISIKSRGRTFEGTVVKTFPTRVVIEFERNIFVKKYERSYTKKTRLHAYLPEEFSSIDLGDYIQIRETRPLSKIIHFIVTKVIRKSDSKEGKK